LLREEYGFDGVVVSDALEMAAAAGTAGGVGAAAVRALRAGADLLCFGADIDADLVESVLAGIGEAVSAGALPVARLEQAAGRNAALAAWTRGAGGGPPEPPDLGYQAARRAVRIEGTLAGLAGALVVQLESGHSLAEGRVPWGLRPHLADGAVVQLDAAHTSSEQLRERAGDRPLIVVGRHLHRSPPARSLVEKLAANEACVVIEMGWPSSWRPTGARAFITTHGASHAHGAALVEVLGLG
jgi:beta-N-acetylhexosaminidase